MLYELLYKHVCVCVRVCVCVCARIHICMLAFLTDDNKSS